MDSSLSLLDNIMQFMQEQSSTVQWVLLAIMALIALYFIWATITNFFNFIFGVIAFFLSVIAAFFAWKFSEEVAYFLSPNPPSWLYWAIPLAAPLVVFTIVVVIKNRISYSVNQDDELELERRRKNHNLTSKDKARDKKPKKTFFKQLFTTLFLGGIFVSCLFLYLTISGKSNLLQSSLPSSALNLTNLSKLDLNDLEAMSEQVAKLADIKELGLLSQFILYEAQAPTNLQRILPPDNYQTIMQLPIEEWLTDPSFNKAAQQENNAALLMKIVQKTPHLTPEIKAALANFEVTAQDSFEK